MVLDLESLRLLAWALIGVVMIGLVLFEGLSLGVITLMPMLSASDVDKDAMRKCLAPTSLTGMGWFVLLVTLMFGAWPIAYAVSLASLYWLWFLLLVSMMFRPLALFFMDAFDLPGWQRIGFKLLVVSGLVPAAVLGLAAGNVIKGIPFHLDSDMRILFSGDFGGLFNLFSLLVMLTCLALLVLHGSVYMQLKTQAELQLRARQLSFKAGVAFLVLFAASGLWITHLEGYHITSDILPNAASNPLVKFVKRGEGLWLDNYEHMPVLWGMPALACMAAIAAIWLSRVAKVYGAMIASSLCVTMSVLTFGVSIFPFLLPSNLSLNSSLTIWDSSASALTLQALLGAAAFALPVIFLISRWGFCLVKPCRETALVVKEG